MRPQSPRQQLAAQHGAVILETLISILIFSMAVLALVGLQASMIKNTSDSKYRADAGYLAQQRIGAMWADPDNVAVYLEQNTDISLQLPGGTRSVTQIAPGQYQVTITWQVPGEPMHNLTTIASISGG